MARHANNAARGSRWYAITHGTTAHKLADVAVAVVESHLLLLPPPRESGELLPGDVDATAEGDPPTRPRG